MKQKLILSSAIALFLASNYLNAQYRIPVSVVGGGGSTVSSSTFRLSSTAGQPLIGSSASPTFRKHVGFWRPAQLLTPVEQVSELIPTEYRLDQNFPNPFNPSTTISFALPSRSFVLLKVFDLLGKEVAVVVSEDLPAGSYSQRWNTTNVPTGVYFYRLRAGPFMETKKLVLLK